MRIHIKKSVQQPTLKSLVIEQFGGQIILRNDSYEGTDICFEIIV